MADPDLELREWEGGGGFAYTADFSSFCDVFCFVLSKIRGGPPEPSNRSATEISMPSGQFQESQKFTREQ